TGLARPEFLDRRVRNHGNSFWTRSGFAGNAPGSDAIAKGSNRCCRGFNITVRVAPNRYAESADGGSGGGVFAAAHRDRTLRSEPNESSGPCARVPNDPPVNGEGGSGQQWLQGAAAP